MKTLLLIAALAVGSFTASAQNIYDISGTKVLRLTSVTAIGQATNSSVSVRPFIGVGFIMINTSANVTNIIIQGSTDNSTFTEILNYVPTSATNYAARFDFSGNPIYIRSIIGADSTNGTAAITSIGQNKSN